MELLTQPTETGHRLRIDADRQFDGRAGDSTLRIKSENEDGSQVSDAMFVETTPEEATLVSWWLRAMRSPPPELQEKIAQEVHATFGSCLSGRDAHQVAELTMQTVVQEAIKRLGSDPASSARIEQLAERFERGAARARHPATTTSAGT